MAVNPGNLMDLQRAFSQQRYQSYRASFKAFH